MNELIFTSATKLAELIRAGDVSSEEVVRACLNRIDSVNPELNAVVRIRREEAIEEARSMDRLLKQGKCKGTLHGVPMTIKDSIETAGDPTTTGTLGRIHHIPDRDASVVESLRNAGAVIIGKTNVPELCLAFESDNLIYGRTNNPYDVSRTAGGSSGGEAAIIAAGGSPIGLGSDAGGSVRVPAHCCGIASIKPTSGRLPKTGHFMPPGGTLDGLWQIGPMARFVEDLALTLPVLAKPDWRDASVVPMPLGDPAAVNLKELRIAFYTDNGIARTTPETANIVREAASEFGRIGAVMEQHCPPGMEQTCEMWCDLIGADGGVGIRNLLEAIGTQRTHPLLDRFLEIIEPRAISTTEFGGLIARWDQMRTGMLSFMKDYDAILCPAAATPALPHGSSFDQLSTFSYTMIFNFTGWPAAVVRCGTSPEGLPINVQIAARPWREDVALAAAMHLEKVFGGWRASAEFGVRKGVSA